MDAPLQQFRDALLAGPDHFPQKIDLAQRLMLFVRLSRADFQRASFLDDRILTANTQGYWMRFDDVEAALVGQTPARSLNFIFHAGHVGSTLLSRLLEEAGGVLALREPLPLRTLAEAQDMLGAPEAEVNAEQCDALMRGQLTLWSRGYADTRQVIVKATSTSARLAPRLMATLPQAKAIYLNLKLEPYLAALLAGENSIFDLQGHAAERLRRLEAFAAPAPTPLHAMSAGELAALAWVTEKLTQTHLERIVGARVLGLDFEAMLGNINQTMRAACAHLGLGAPEAYFAGIAQSPALARYAKAPEAAFSPDLRAQLMAQARARHGEEIAKGKRWVEALALRAPGVAALL